MMFSSNILKNTLSENLVFNVSSSTYKVGCCLLSQIIIIIIVTNNNNNNDNKGKTERTGQLLKRFVM